MGQGQSSPGGGGAGGKDGEVRTCERGSFSSFVDLLKNLSHNGFKTCCALFKHPLFHLV